jgi:hypothetical protein
MRAGEVSSVSSCALALAVKEAGDLLPGITDVANVEITSALEELNRLPELSCTAKLNGNPGWLRAYAEEHFAFEVAYCNDTDRGESIARRLDDRHKPVEIAFTRVTFRTHRRGDGTAVTAPPLSPDQAQRHLIRNRAYRRVISPRKNPLTEEDVRGIASVTAVEAGITDSEELRQYTNYLLRGYRTAAAREKAKADGTYVPRRTAPRHTDERWL